MIGSDLDILDRIYEAAFVPDEWPTVLDDLSGMTKSLGGVLLIANRHRPPRWVASLSVRDAVQAFSEGEAWRDNDRPSRFLAAGHGGFIRDVDFMSETEVARDPMHHELLRLGLGWQTGATIPLPYDEALICSLERRYSQGPHASDAPHLLNELRPHLARAGLIAARLGLELARNTVSAFQAIGLSAAVLSHAGSVRVTNELLDAMGQIFMPAAFGGMTIADPAANSLFRQAVEATAGNVEPVARSIPIKPRDTGLPLVIHVLPLRRSAHDIFSGGDILVAVTAVSARNLVPSPMVLSGLFDLAPSEARLAVTLTQGQSLKAFAAEAGITFGTARKYLDRIYLKTGTHSQSQLVALLKGAQPLNLPDSGTYPSS